VQTAEFFRAKANRCRAMLADIEATARDLNALALELDARALAVEAGSATVRETTGDGYPSWML
jgi:hypothetical protein